MKYTYLKIVHLLSFELGIKTAWYMMQVAFEGVVGSSFTGDIALDDIFFFDDVCHGHTTPTTTDRSPTTVTYRTFYRNIVCNVYFFQRFSVESKRLLFIVWYSFLIVVHFNCS